MKGLVGSVLKAIDDPPTVEEMREAIAGVFTVRSLFGDAGEYLYRSVTRRPQWVDSSAQGKDNDHESVTLGRRC